MGNFGKTAVFPGGYGQIGDIPHGGYGRIGVYRVKQSYLLPVAEVEAEEYERQGDAEPHTKQSDHRGEGNLVRERHVKIASKIHDLRGDIKIPTYKPQKYICELTYFSPDHHM